MSAIWDFLRDAENRAIIFGFLGLAGSIFSYFVPKPKKGWALRLWNRVQSVLGAVPIRSIAWLFAVVAVVSFGYYILLRTQPVLRVCEGQFGNECESNDVFVGCYGLDKWKNRCWHYKYIERASVRDGRMCGYTIHRVRCGDGPL
jgi:hypothetical protein